eukprot:TRINITY_DN20250_c0_g1_i1.p1 TRINITY_DN20250_c0_g1~~TRINITY_DN20250_c0_g1_i1.p1  ORF type:complete len:374 (-),score=57.91 TRINITY_DN20250_c0_g1_i1:115-1236(-)
MAAMELTCSGRSPIVQKSNAFALKPYSNSRQQRNPRIIVDSPAAIRAKRFLEMEAGSSKCPEEATLLEENVAQGSGLSCATTGSDIAEYHRQRKRHRRLSAVSSDDLEFCSQTLDGLPEQKALNELSVNVMPLYQTSDSLHTYMRSENTPASPTSEKLQHKHKNETDVPKPPSLSATEWLQDEHFTYVIENWMEPPSHCWIATPAQVVLMLSGQDRRDRCVGRDGNLRSLWDSPGIHTLLLPFNSDKQAGRRACAGSHWSLLVVRSRKQAAGYEVKAQLIDSLTAPPSAASKTASELLRCLADSQHWRGVPRRPELHALGLQHDNYQCGIFCLLAMHHELKIEAGETMARGRITASMANRLRQRLCDSSRLPE